ncbi:MAG: hypothetical protein WA639_03320 [Candidatus Acidiferrum sp.]
MSIRMPDTGPQSVVNRNQDIWSCHLKQVSNDDALHTFTQSTAS